MSAPWPKTRIVTLFLSNTPWWGGCAPSWSHLRASLIHELAEDPSIRIYYPSCDSIPSNLPHVSVFGALQEASSIDLFHTRSNPLSPASFNLRDLAEELSPNPKSRSRVACEWLAVHAILLCSNISIAVYASLMCMVRLLCQFTLRFLELMKIVRSVLGVSPFGTLD